MFFSASHGQWRATLLAAHLKMHRLQSRERYPGHSYNFHSYFYTQSCRFSSNKNAHVYCCSLLRRTTTGGSDFLHVLIKHPLSRNPTLFSPLERPNFERTKGRFVSVKQGGAGAGEELTRSFVLVARCSVRQHHCSQNRKAVE